MKSINDENGNNMNHDNWLGFSLSPHMKMEATSTCSNPHLSHHHSEAQITPTCAESFYLSSSHINNGGNNNAVCYGDFHSPLSMMPLKSDGSLCIMEAFSKSQGMVQSSSPKLEDFLGGATMAAHDYGSHSRESMVLSLDSIFYNQEPFRQQQHYYPSLNTNPLYQTPNEDKQPQFVTQIPQMSENEMKTWIDNHHALEQHINNGDLQSLSLSMSPGSQSSCVTASRQTETITEGLVMENTKKRGSEKMGQKQTTVHRKSIDTFGQRTSQYRGVTRHRWTGRYEAHLWDNSCKKEGQTRKGRQVYLGGYDMEEKAARAYDLAAIKYWGPSTHINFSLENYHQEIEETKNMSRQEYVAHLRRKSSGFSRGASIYRGVTRHHQHGRWQARIGRVAGNKDLYLGTFSTQEEAAEAYDIAAIKFRGVNAVTNFDMSKYDVEKIIASNTLPTGDIAKRKRDENQHQEPNTEASFAQMDNIKPALSEWKMVAQNQAPINQENVAIIGTMGSLNYQNSSFSIGLHDLTGLDVDEQRVSMGHHFSNPSSLVTSLSSSREASPDKNGGPIVFSSNVNSWIGNEQMRPTVQMPTFCYLE